MSQTHLVGYAHNIEAIRRTYQLGGAEESGRLRVHPTVADLAAAHTPGDRILMGSFEVLWLESINRIGLGDAPRVWMRNHPYDFHLALMEFSAVTDKRRMIIDAILSDIYYRPHFAFALSVLAEEARRMGLKRVAAVEFGVWRGDGLKNLGELARIIEDCTGVGFDVYGFDSGVGMPAPADWRDHPEIWKEGEMAMPDADAVRAELPDNCELIVGPIADTIDDFRATRMSADVPLGFISFDMDYYSSTTQSLQVMENPADHYMPAMTAWVNNSYINILQSNKAGEGRALLDFNDTHDLRKFDFKVIRPDQDRAWWHNGIWFGHIFDHPMRSGEATPADFNDFFVTDY